MNILCTTAFRLSIKGTITKVWQYMTAERLLYDFRIFCKIIFLLAAENIDVQDTFSISYDLILYVKIDDPFFT